MTDNEILLERFVREVVKEMISDGDIRLVKDVHDAIGIGYYQETIDGGILRTEAHGELDTSRELKTYSIYSA